MVVEETQGAGTENDECIWAAMPLSSQTNLPQCTNALVNCDDGDIDDSDSDDYDHK